MDVPGPIEKGAVVWFGIEPFIHSLIGEIHVYPLWYAWAKT